MSHRDPIAIVGIGCRFPGSASDPDSFWKLLRNGVDAVSEVPPDRWSIPAYHDPSPGKPGKTYSRWGGFVENMERFDPTAFGISPREAAYLDPQQRLLLETAWEAFEDAGIVSNASGSPTGVYVGISNSDYMLAQTSPGQLSAIGIHSLTGQAFSIAANRISYVFNLLGPSMAVDTACSSALMAVHFACLSLWKGECETALAGGVNYLLVPNAFVGFSRMAMLSPEGRCKAFDASADGFVRAEGAGIVVLKRYSQAIADGDRVYAVILGSAANQDGHTTGMTLPNESSQTLLVKQACADAGVDPKEVVYVEAHGTGTAAGDPIEARALGQALGSGRPAEKSCIIGSVKTNIGHLESGAGIAGLIKAALVLYHRQVPPNLHFNKPNPAIPFSELGLRVARELESLPPPPSRLVAGVNSFGFGGANAHVMLASAPVNPFRSEPSEGACRRGSQAEVPRDSTFLLPLSARSRASLVAASKAWIEFLQPGGAGAEARLEDICYTAAARRTHHPHRLAIVADDRGRILECLRAFSEQKPCSGLVSGQVSGGRKPRVVFVFSGQGPQWWGMGRELFEQEAVFRSKLLECEASVLRHAGWSLLGELRKDEKTSRIQDTSIAQPALFAVQVALAELWKTWGIQPDAVVGHSVGEAAAACISGALELDEAVRVIVRRGECMESPEGRGRMMAIGLSREEAERVLAEFKGDVALAAVNSPVSVTLAGDEEALRKIAEAAAARRCFSSFLSVGYAFHSPRMESASARLRKELAGIQPRDASIPIISTLTGKPVPGSALDAEFWASGVRQTVEFASAIEYLDREGYDVFLELAPHPVLQRYIKDCHKPGSGDFRVLPTLVRKQPERATLLKTLGALHVHGVPVAWESVQPQGGRHVSLPLYRWQRERYWHESEEHREARLKPQVHPLLQRSLRGAQPAWETEVSPQLFPYLADHRVQGYVVFPGAAYAEMALEAAQAGSQSGSKDRDSGSCVLEDVEILKALLLAEGEERAARLQLFQAPEEGAFTIYARTSADGPWAKHATGKVRFEEIARASVEDFSINPGTEKVDLSRLYGHWKKLGLQFGPMFQRITELWRKDGEVIGRVSLDASMACDGYVIHPALLDACFQALIGAIPADFSGKRSGLAFMDRPGTLYLPTRLGRLWCRSSRNSTLGAPPLRGGWVKGRISRQDERIIEGDIRLLDEQGRVMFELRGFRCEAVESERRNTIETLDGALHELRWEARELPGGAARPLDYVPSLSAVLEKADRVAAEAISAFGFGDERYIQAEAWTDEVCRAYVLKALRTLGWDPREGDVVSVPSLMAKIRILPKYERLLGRYLLMLEQGNLLSRRGSEWVVSRMPADPDLAAWSDLLASAPACHAELTLGRCYAEALPEILRGIKDPVQVGFSHNSFTTFDHLYRDGMWCRPYNVMLQEAVAALLSTRPRGRRIRVLELGAGTGGLASHILPLLPPDETEYVFTDVSKNFFARAEQKFRAYPFIQYRILDIERDPQEQGFLPGSFDLVLAFDVLHATVELRSTLTHVQRLLVPGGVLAFLEPTRPTASGDLIFGLLDGWWRFQDFDLRPDYPLLPAGRWKELLRETGFAEIAAVLENSRLGTIGHQTAFLARKSPEQAEAQVPDQVPEQVVGPAVDTATVIPISPALWMIFADEQGLGDALADRLKSDGDRCLIIRPGNESEALSGRVPVRMDDSSFRIRPGNSEDIAWLLREVSRMSPAGGSCGMIHFWGIAKKLPQNRFRREAERTHSGRGRTNEGDQSLAVARLREPECGERSPECVQPAAAGTCFGIVSKGAAGSSSGKQPDGRSIRQSDMEPDLEQMDFDRAFAKAQNEGCLTILQLVQGLKQWSHPQTPDLWVITRGAQPTGDESPALLETPIYGLGRVIQTERPDLVCRMIDLDPVAGSEVDTLRRELRAKDVETEVAYRRGIRYVQRIAIGSLVSGPKTILARGPETKVESRSFALTAPSGGVLDNLRFKETSRRAPGPGEVEIEVAAASLNFRDIMKGLGIYPSEENDVQKLGDECAGRIVRTGPGVKGLKAGDEVIALGQSCFASHVVTDARVVARKPAGLTFEEAATIPICFLTAIHALEDLARLAPGERVLIHAGTGGVGLAAIQIARLAGAEIFATAGSPEKREFLKWLGIKHVLDSRSVAFAEEILELTGGQGVDVVLNSLAGEAIPKGISILRPYGRFLEIGKRDIYQHARLDLFTVRNNISFFAIDLAHMMSKRPDQAQDLLRRTVSYVNEGKVHALPFRAFPAWDAAGAFRYMAQARHIGKVLLSIGTATKGGHVPIEPAPAEPALMPVSGDATYLITGGLGGFGLALASHLAERGARHLVLLGRSGATGEAATAVERLRSNGVEVRVAKADVSRRDELASVFRELRERMPPLKGVIHAAMVLDDGLLSLQDSKRFERVMAPKVNGAWNLHLLTRDLPLDFFVMFSSIASVMGGIGQANYAAANTFLDGMAYYRRSRGLPGVTINWGVLSEVGYVSRHQAVIETLDRQGFIGLSTDAAMTILELLAQGEFAQAIAFKLDRRKWTEAFPHRHKIPRFAYLAFEQSASDSTAEVTASIRPRLASAPAGERRPILEEYLREQASQVLRTEGDQIDIRAPLSSSGLDSLMVVELMNRIEAGLKIAVPVGSLVAGRSIAQLAGDLLSLLEREEDKVGDATAALSPSPVLPPGEAGAGDGARLDIAVTDGAAELLKKLDSLPEAEVERLLRERSDLRDGETSTGAA